MLAIWKKLLVEWVLVVSFKLRFWVTNFHIAQRIPCLVLYTADAEAFQWCTIYQMVSSKQVLLHGMLGGGWGVGGEMLGGGSDLVRDVWPQAGLTSPNSPIQLWSQTKRHIHTYIRANSHRHTHPLESHFVWFFGSMVTSQDNPLQRWRGIRWKVVRAALDKKPILCTGLTSGKEGIVGRPPCVSVPPLSPAWLMASLPPQLSMKCLSTGKACIRC